MITKTASQPKLSLWVFLVGLGLAAFGLLAIYDASVVEAYKDFGDKFHFVKQQFVWISIGLVLSLIISNIPSGLLKRFSKEILLFSILLLVVVLIPGIGSKFLGARRWLVFGPIVIQPSELIKVSMVIYLSHWLEKQREMKQFLFLLCLNLILIMLQPDLGTAIIVTGVSFGIYLISGANKKDLLTLVGVMLLGMVILVIASPYRLNRLKTYMNPDEDPLGASYHINQILYGLGSGGLTGVGIGQSRQKYAFLPEATTDSIFVIISEEFGFLGAATLLIAISSIVYLAIKVAVQSKDTFDKLMASGIGLLFFIQLFVNISSMTALLPLTGVPLPFISYGGSSLVTNFIALGLLVNVAKRK